MDNEEHSKMHGQALFCFPSGLTIGSARKEAELRVSNQQCQTMVDALNLIANREMGLNWFDATELLKKRQAFLDDNLPNEKKENQQDKQFHKSKQINKSKRAFNQTTSQERLNMNSKKNEANHSDNHQSKVDAYATSIKDYASLSNTKSPEGKQAVTNEYTLVDIQMLLAKYLNIGFDGFCHHLNANERAEQRARLAVAINSFNIFSCYLEQCQALKNINKKLNVQEIAVLLHESAQNHHVFKDNCEQLSVGALLICAKEKGFQYKTVKSNTYLNISIRSLNKLSK